MSRKYNIMILCWLMAILPAASVRAQGTALDSFMDRANTKSLLDTSSTAEPLSIDTAYTAEDIKKYSVSDSVWDKVTKGLDYSTEKKKDKKKKDKKDNTDDDDGKPFSVIGGNVIQYFAFGVMLVLLAILIVYIFRSSLFLKNTAIKRDGVSFLEDLEENLQESDLERALREALEKRDFRLALRIYYLAILKEMALMKWIVYKKDKTNYEYLRELGSRPQTIMFRDITCTFERFWYGDSEIGEKEYQELSPVFSQFIDQLRKEQHG